MRILSSIAAVALFCSTAVAAPITIFTSDSVKTMVTNAGATNVRAETIATVPFVHFDLEGMKYSASLRFCDSGTSNNCKALLLAIGFEADATDSLEIINGFNNALPFVSVVKPDAATLVFGRFVVAIGGIEPGNVGANLGMLMVSPSIFAEFKKSQVVASNGVGATVMLSQTDGVPARKSVQLTSAQIGSLLKEDVTLRNKVK